MRESYFRHDRVFVVALPGSLISRCESRVASLSRKIFSPSDGAGACLGVEIPPGNVGGDCEGPGLQFSEYWRSWDSDQCGNPERSGQWRGWGQHRCRGDISPAQLTPCPHPCSRPGSVLFCIIIIIITRVSHRPASSARVTGAREPVPKQYQENKSEDQL